MPDDWGRVMGQWKEAQNTPWVRFRYKSCRRNIARHLGNETSLRVLDVGGGNGFDSIYFAKQGHSVTLVDGSPEMLAEATRTATDEGVSDRLVVRQVDADAIDDLFDEPAFDLILCHLMIEFVGDQQALLRKICRLLVPGGLLSLLDVNRFSEAYRLAFYEDNLSDALRAVDRKDYFHPCVQRLTPRFSAQEFIDDLAECTCTLVGHYGVHCIYYYLPADRKTDPEYCAELEKLEQRLSDTYPYYLLARFYHVIARKEC